MPRLFVAIELPEPLRQELILAALGVPDARLTPLEQLNLTLRFVGETDAQGFEDLREALHGVDGPAFELTARGVGCFPRKKQPRVLWAGFAESGELAALQRKVERAVVRAGFEPEGRRFHAHVTLARLKNGRPQRVARWLEDHAPLSAPAFDVEEFRLYSSRLLPSGAVHQVEESYALSRSWETREEQG